MPEVERRRALVERGRLFDAAELEQDVRGVDERDRDVGVIRAERTLATVQRAEVELERLGLATEIRGDRAEVVEARQRGRVVVAEHLRAHSPGLVALAERVLQRPGAVVQRTDVVEHARGVGVLGPQHLGVDPLGAAVVGQRFVHAAERLEGVGEAVEGAGHRKLVERLALGEAREPALVGVNGFLVTAEAEQHHAVHVVEACRERGVAPGASDSRTRDLGRV